MLNQDAERAVKSFKIPPCPEILTSLVREMRTEEPDFRKVSNLVARDVGLGATLLRTVNSPAYGLRTKATSVHHALTVLGLNAIVQIMTGLLLRQAFPAAQHPKMQEIWEASSQVAEITAALAVRTRVVDRDAAYTFGLFRDCGIPALMMHFDDYAQTLDDAAKEVDRKFTAVEDERYWTNHAEAGHTMAEAWFLPKTICDAILWHHDYAVLEQGHNEIADGSRKLIALALIAEWLAAQRAGSYPANEWLKGGTLSLQCVGSSEQEMQALARELEILRT